MTLGFPRPCITKWTIATAAVFLILFGLHTFPNLVHLIFDCNKTSLMPAIYGSQVIFFTDNHIQLTLINVECLCLDNYMNEEIAEYFHLFFC